jgi:hypothetical protein
MLCHPPSLASWLRCGLTVLVASMSLMARPPTQSVEVSGARARIVRQVDHVLLVSPAANRIFDTLTGELRLPVAWPFTSYGAFTSGGVALGNVNLEIIAAPTTTPGVDTTRFSGLALEPEPLTAALAELEARHLKHGEAAPSGPRWLARLTRPRWTLVSLPGVSAPGVEVFLCEFGHDVAARRRPLRDELDSRSGGPLGVLGVNSILYGTHRREELEAQWRQLLAPEAPVTNGVWRIGEGPMLRLVTAQRDAVSELVIGVRSLEAARRFLLGKGWLGIDSPASLTLGGPVFQNLRIRLEEGQAAAP